MKKRTNILILFLLPALLLAACSSGAPATPDPTEVQLSVDATLTAVAASVTDTPVPTPVPPTPTAVPPTATPTLEPTPVPVEGDPVLILGSPDGEDNFINDNNWTLFDDSCFTSVIADGQFQMTANGLQGVSCWEVSWPLLENYYLETQVEMPAACDPQDRFGFFFRAPDNNRGYLYGLTCGGQFSLTKWDGAETTELVPLTSSALIDVNPGALNRVGLAVYNGTYLLYINGVYAGQTQDFTYVEPGKIGYFVRAATDQPFTSAYNYQKVWQLDDAFIPPEGIPPENVTPIPPPEAGVPTVTTVTYVNVRSGPGLNYPIYFVAEPGASAQAVGITSDGAWYAVSIPSFGTGWVSASYVIAQGTESLPVVPVPPVPPTIVPPPPPVTVLIGTTTEPLNVRSGPSNDYPSYGMVPVGTNLQILGISADNIWYSVAIPTGVAPDGTGWVNAKYIEVNAYSPDQAPPVITPPEVPPTVNPPPPTSDMVYATSTDTISVRSGPGNEYDSYGKATSGMTAPVVGISADGKWYAVSIPTDIAPDGIGWVNASYVSITNESGQEIPVIQ